MTEGLDYFRPTETTQKGFCLATLKNLMKDWPGGSHIVMKITPRVPCGRPIMSIGYKYNYKKVLGFIPTDGAGITKPGDPYFSSFPEIY